MDRTSGAILSGWALGRHPNLGLTRSVALPGADVRSLDAVSTRELADLTGVSQLDLSMLVEYGVLSPLDEHEPSVMFSVRSIPTLRKASRLRQDLALDSDTFALASLLLFEIARCEDEARVNRAARAST